ncbi:MAG: hypothetical protein Fur0021_30220 [Candidatus Promineifilaceae bacterium]
MVTIVTLPASLTVSRVLATYDQFLLAKATEAQIQTLQRQGFIVAEQPAAHMIRLRAVEFDTATDTVHAAPNNAHANYRLVQSDLNQLFQQSYTNGVRIHTNSWGNYLMVNILWNRKRSVKKLNFSLVGCRLARQKVQLLQRD